MIPMLATPATFADVGRLGRDETWAIEQKVDGWRALVVFDAEGWRILNREGAPSSMALPRCIADDLDRARARGVVFDGEVVGDTLHLFDLPCASGHVDAADPLAYRREVLELIVAEWAPRAVRVVPQARSRREKAELLAKIRTMGGEGVVLKRLDAPYETGNRSRNWLKVKYTRQVDCFVTELRRDGKDNMVVAVYDDGEEREIGEVTALAGDGPRIGVGDVVAVTYLYFTRSGRLYQPTLPKLRTDKAKADCTIDQLVVVNKEVL